MVGIRFGSGAVSKLIVDNDLRNSARIIQDCAAQEYRVQRYKANENEQKTTQQISNDLITAGSEGTVLSRDFGRAC